MINLSPYELFEIVTGLSFLWVSAYLLSKNPTNFLSWTAFFFLASIGIVLVTDPILIHSRTFDEYVWWQKITSWPLFFSPVFFYHASVLASGTKSKLSKYLIIFGYFSAAVYFIMELHGGLILKESIMRYADYKRFDGFAAGSFMVPSVGTASVYAILGTLTFLKETKKSFYKFFFPALGGMIYFLTGILTIFSYYFFISWANIAFTVGISFGALFLAFSLVRFHLCSPAEKIFDRNFLYKTIGVVLIALLYILSFEISKLPMNFESLVLFISVLTLVFFTHSFYEWLITFINDLLFNPRKGLSVVNDEEVYQALKNYQTPEKIENSSLLRLNLVKNSTGKTPVDSLRLAIENAIDYFKPEKDANRRIKKNLKYYLLKMFVFDEAEEGQILWELGFEEYPVKIMSQERRYRTPLFETKSPSDYTYTSRNAFIALKKEAIHDVTWRISYLEKQAKKKFL